ncbi:MAG: PEP-utilizing enzyme, partial [Gammaproteobacteria bacterium]|nr:PEP-utilizing enzyme [Gammaproteobacteria bacterium]
MSLSLSGIGVSRGVAIGKAHIILRGSIEVLESTIPEHLIDNEIARFLSAVDSARLQLQAIQKRIPANTGVDIAAFIETHLLMLDDAMLVTIPVDLIREHHCNAEWALKLQRDAVVSVFEKMDDAYLRTRRDDIDHVINRIQRFLLDSSQSDDQGENIVMDNAIVLAYDLTPAESVMLEHQGIKAFATECGGPLSHTAIHARSMQIPAMVGTHGLQRYIQDGETVILDGLQGVLIAAADEQMLDYYR